MVSLLTGFPAASRDELQSSSMKYTARPISDIDNGPGCWKSQTIGVFADEAQVGSYKRNYSSFMGTFCPFMKGDNWYALYSSDYTSTRIMELPSCMDIGGEERDAWGFCPTGYFVPKFYRYTFTTEGKEHMCRIYESDEGEEDKRDQFDDFGFISGCVWGDDSSWKIQYLDLSQADKGIIKRDDRFGYIELPPNLTLEKAIRMLDHGDRPPYGFQIACDRSFRANGKSFDEPEQG